MMIHWFTILISFIILTTSLTAQNTDGPCKVCWSDPNMKSCDIIIITECGVHKILTPNDYSKVQIVGDYGMLLKIDENNAFGASISSSIFVNEDFMIGPELRYRRWLGAGHSIDFALGFWLSSWLPHLFVKWNPIHWVGIALRVDLLDKLIYRTVKEPGGVTVMYFDYKRSFYISIGVEISGVPGAVISVTGAAIVGVFALLLGGGSR